uniref:urease accessory protein UreF n=1 Tax=Alistipes sp. TaxID=1872444 RepID=UPI0040567123
MPHTITMDSRALFRLIAFSDSAFPIGGFSFSCGLETAAFEGLVYDEKTLEAYVQTMTRVAATSDGVAALVALRALARGDWAELLEADRAVWISKTGHEAQRMTHRIGRKLLDLMQVVLPCEQVERWAELVKRNESPCTMPISQAVLFSAAGLGPEALFSSIQYGMANMILQAALRTIRISHLEAQRILYGLSTVVEERYGELCDYGLDQMAFFAPEAEILASLHEQGRQRLFMN